MNKLLVVWFDKTSQLYYHVGTLSYSNHHYEFVYTTADNGLYKLDDALEHGYMLHPAFPDRNKVYQSNTLFPAFDRRLPSADRSDFKTILSNYNLNESSTKMELLQRTRGVLASDAYSFEQVNSIEDINLLHSTVSIKGIGQSISPEQWHS